MDTIPPQPTVMVTGGDERRVRSVANELFEERATAVDGAVVVITGESPAATVRRLCDESAVFARDRLAVVDVRGAERDDPGVGFLERLEPGADPDAVDGAVTAALEWLDDAGVERRHFRYDALGADPGLPDVDATYARAYRLAMTVGAEDGLALFALDGDGLPPDVVERLGHLFDVQIELRDVEGDAHLRWTGLLGESEDWVGLAEADLDVGGFR